MRLLRPSPGEAVDRQTILHLKSKYGNLKHVNVKPFNDEINELQEYLQRNWFTKISDEKGQEFDRLWQLLKAVNNDLWKVEDEVRILMKSGTSDQARLAEIAVLVPTLNDKRGNLVQEINRLFSVAEQEKIYIAQ